MARGTRPPPSPLMPSRREAGTCVLAPLPLERLVLVVLVWGRERAEDLLGGLGEAEQGRARGLLAGFAALSSSRRQARVAVEFGVRPDAEVRLRGVVHEASEVLRRELLRRLPPYHRGLFPPLSPAPAGPEAPRRVRVLAERLIREATR